MCKCEPETDSRSVGAHIFSAPLYSRPSSQIAVLTPLISFDICMLLSLLNLFFFFFLIKINPNGHPLIGPFLGELRGMIIKIIKPQGQPPLSFFPHFFFEVWILQCLQNQKEEKTRTVHHPRLIALTPLSVVQLHKALCLSLPPSSFRDTIE